MEELTDWAGYEELQAVDSWHLEHVVQPDDVQLQRQGDILFT